MYTPIAAVAAARTTAIIVGCLAFPSDGCGSSSGSGLISASYEIEMLLSRSVYEVK
jgi:hypothetical protein